MSSNKATAEDQTKPVHKPNGTLVEREKEQVGKVYMCNRPRQFDIAVVIHPSPMGIGQLIFVQNC